MKKHGVYGISEAKRTRKANSTALREKVWDETDHVLAPAEAAVAFR